MVRVKVQRISSTSDPETRKPGKQIELVEERSEKENSVNGIMGGSIEGMPPGFNIEQLMSKFQSMGFLPLGKGGSIFPKMILFLTEEEYDLLAIRFEVNDVFDMIIKDGAFMLKRSVEGT
mgnify:CR=1 FL=1